MSERMRVAAVQTIAGGDVADNLAQAAALVAAAAAPCTAMVFVWSRLTDGDPYFTLSQVA